MRSSVTRRLSAAAIALTAVPAMATDTSATDVAPATQTNKAASAKPAAKTSAEKLTAIAASAYGWLATHDTPSVAIAYIESGRVSWTAAFGEQQPGVAASVNSVYNIASMTKPLVGETILRLASKGAIDLNASMAEHWVDPDIANDPRHKQLTPAMALRHRTGFPNWRSQTDGSLTFKQDPGSAAGYSGEGYQYVARYVEKKLGQPFDKLVAQALFEPLELNDIAFRPKPSFTGRIAYAKGPDGSQRLPDAQDEWNAADDVHATVGDYATFLTAVMRGDGISSAIAEQKYTLIENVAERLCGPGRITPPDCPQSLGFAMGWAVYETDSAKIVMQGGGDWGERTLGFFDLRSQTGAVIFTNGANGQKVIRDVARILFPDPSFIAFLTMQAR